VEQQRQKAGWLLWQSLGHVGRALRPQMEPLLHEMGLSSPLEVWVLQHVRHEGPRRLVDIARATRLPTSTLSDLTERLVAEGFLSRRPNPGDRRSVVLVVTQRAEDALTRLQAGVVARLEGPLAQLDDATVEQLTTGLRALTEVLDRAVGPYDTTEGAPQRLPPDGAAPDGPRGHGDTGLRLEG
jgi:DNA-binding MarR family transcriptional regulator